MRILKQTPFILILLSLTLHFIGCDDSASSNKEPQNYEEALADLKKVANSVDALSIGQEEKSTDFRRRELEFFEDTSDEYTQIFTMIDTEEGFKYYDTTQYFNPTTNELLKVKDAWENETYKTVFSYYMEDLSIKGHWKGSMLMSSGMVSDTDYSYNMDATYTGYLDYYKDDLKLEFYDVQISSTDDVCDYVYNFTFMDGKYKVLMSGKLNLNDLLDETVIVEMLSGPVYDKDDAIVGTFKVYTDDSVKIYDKDGNLIKKAS